jgi:hypothetical protein
MDEIAEIMGAVTNCAVAGIQAGRDIGKAERDKLQTDLDKAVACLRDIANAAHDYDQQGPDSRFHDIEYMACRFLAKAEADRILAREDAAWIGSLLGPFEQSARGSISPHNHRRILETRSKRELERTYDQICLNAITVPGEYEKELKASRALLTEALAYMAHANTCATQDGTSTDCDCDLDDFIGRALKAAE